MRKLSIITLVLALHTMFLFAAKVAYNSRTVTLQDGRAVVVHMQGDENVHFLYSDDGDLIIQDDLGYHVATQSEVDSINAELERYTQECEEMRAKAIAGLRANTGEGINGDRLFPHTGKPKVLVLMTEFSDVKFTYTKQDIENMLSGTAITSRFKKNSVSYTSGQPDTIRRNHPYYSYSSVREYFKASSDGQFEPEFDVYGPFSVSNTSYYYGRGSDNVLGLAREACALADSIVDFSQYDQDGDGNVDLVYIVFAGYGANVTGNDDHIWSKCGNYSVGSYDGKSVFRVGVSNERLHPDVSQINGIGVLCHEFSHALGLPDFYPTVSWNTTYNGKSILDCSKYDNQSMEDWDLMDNGLNVSVTCWPPLYTAFERELMGWGTIDTLSTPTDVVMKPLMHGGKAYRILNDNDPTGNEYWILEAVSADSLSEKWHQYMPGRGLLITHVNYDSEAFSSFRKDATGTKVGGNVNNVQGKPRMTVIPADGFLPTSYRDRTVNSAWKMTTAELLTQESGDTYPGSQGVTEFNNYKAYTGTVDKPLTEITQVDDITVSFKFMGGTPLLLGDVNNDDFVTMADANMVVNYYLADDAAKAQMIENGFNIETADMNSDIDITMADANAIVNVFLSSETEGE